MKNRVCLLLILLLAGCYSKEPIKTAHNGAPIPAFPLFLADSSTYFNTSSLPAGKPVVFFYFGPSCPYSRAQMEGIIDDMEQFKEVEWVIFTTAPFHEMKWFYKHYKLDEHPNVITGVDYTNFFMKYFKTNGVPYLAIYGPDKRLKAAFEGQTPVRQLRNIAIN